MRGIVSVGPVEGSVASSAASMVTRAAGAAFPGLDDKLAVMVGVAAVLGAGYRVPLAAVVFVAEATGRPGFIVPALLAAVAADLMMGRHSVTTYQQPSPAGPPDQGGDAAGG